MIESDTHTDAECENGKPHGEARQAESPTREQTTEASPSAVAPSSISPAVEVFAMVDMGNEWFDGREYHPYGEAV